MSFNIISFKRLHFQKHEYVKDKNGELTAVVKAEIIVAADARPQIVPDWVKDEDLFKLCVEDGTVQHIAILSSTKKSPGVNNVPKVNIKGVEQAKFADTSVATVEGEEPTPVAATPSASVDWPKPEAVQANGLQPR